MDNAATPTPDLPTTPEARAAFIKEAQQRGNFAGLMRLFQAELLALPAFAEAMQAYLPESAAHVAAAYASAKAAAYLRGPVLVQAEAAHFVQIREAAAQALWEIQQKKLFDLQCRWRAEQITLPGIRHTQDFRRWEQYVEHCPWLPPLTADEVSLYESYLRSDAYVPSRNWNYQDYDTFRRAAGHDHPADDEDEAPKDSTNPDLTFKADERRAYRTPPAWYGYHDAATGHRYLLTLPDLRGEKEAYYIHLAEADKAEKLAAQRAAGVPSADLAWHPVLLSDADLTPYFQRYETPADLPRLLRWYEADRLDFRDRNGYLFEAQHWLEQALYHQPAPWPIEAHADWRLAIIKTGQRAWGQRLAEVLADVWREQQQHQALGLPITGPKLYGTRPPLAELNWAEEDSYRPKFILRGRELAGEPRDFNF